ENAVDLIKEGVTDYVPKDNLFTLISKIKRGLKEADERREKILTDEKLRLQTAELIFANMELATQNKEKEKRAQELSITNNELHQSQQSLQNTLKELATANKELEFQNKFIIKSAEKLATINKKLANKISENKQRTAELIAANEALALHYAEKEKRTVELDAAYSELKKAEKYQKEYIRGLEEMMFMTSHQVRIPITNILGIAGMLEKSMNSPEKLMKLVEYIKQSALILDLFTKDLSIFMADLEQKGKNKNEKKRPASILRELPGDEMHI
ncbi:MAG: hypothetical protein M3Q97_03880, partial [Bacteroidota bacterium]|nr:hypothetical protein [Bacteroidota bacterium]